MGSGEEDALIETGVEYYIKRQGDGCGTVGSYDLGDRHDYLTGCVGGIYGPSHAGVAMGNNILRL